MIKEFIKFIATHETPMQQAARNYKTAAQINIPCWNPEFDQPESINKWQSLKKYASLMII